MKKLGISLNTLTPLWTGDAEGKSEKLKLAGIIGSLRWWFEALVRGTGYYACDITSEKSNKECRAEIKNFEDIITIYEKICPVCFIFGTTGWKSRFSLNIENDNLQKSYNGKVVVKLNDGRGWHYEAGLMGEATLAFQYDEFYLKEDLKFSDVFPSILKILLYLIQEHGMLGAKTSMGYGVVKFKLNGSDLTIAESDWEKFKKYLELFAKSFKKEVKYLPNLKDMFFVKFKVDSDFDNILQNIKRFYRFQDGISEGDIDKWKDLGWLTTSPVLRNCLRCIFRGKYSNKECKFLRSCTRNYWWNKRNNQQNRNYNSDKTIDVLNLDKKETENIRHFFMGSTQEPEFSAIQVSHVYTNNGNLEFRIYGWLPDKEPIKSKVEDVLGLLSHLFNDAPWKERYDSTQKKKVSLLPSQIKDDICWRNNNLKLLDGDGNIQKLFFKQGENQ